MESAPTSVKARAIFEPTMSMMMATTMLTWITTRSMPIPGAENNGVEHVGWDAVIHVANSGKAIDTGYIPETLSYPHWRVLAAEDDHVVLQFTMACRTRAGKDYINDYLFLFGGMGLVTYLPRVLPFALADKLHLNTANGTVVIPSGSHGEQLEKIFMILCG